MADIRDSKTGDLRQNNYTLDRNRQIRLQMQEQSRSMQQPLMYFTTHSMRQTASDSVMQEIYMED